MLSIKWQVFRLISTLSILSSTRQTRVSYSLVFAWRTSSRAWCTVWLVQHSSTTSVSRLSEIKKRSKRVTICTRLIRKMSTWQCSHASVKTTASCYTLAVRIGWWGIRRAMKWGISHGRRLMNWYLLQRRLLSVLQLIQLTTRNLVDFTASTWHTKRPDSCTNQINSTSSSLTTRAKSVSTWLTQTKGKSRWSKSLELPKIKTFERETIRLWKCLRIRSFSAIVKSVFPNASTICASRGLMILWASMTCWRRVI